MNLYIYICEKNLILFGIIIIGIYYYMDLRSALLYSDPLQSLIINFNRRGLLVVKLTIIFLINGLCRKIVIILIGKIIYIHISVYFIFGFW